MKSTIRYTKSETVTIELTVDEIKLAIRAYLSNRLDIPESAEFDFQVSSYETFEGLEIKWTEGPETSVEEID